ncbi:Uncharacterized protein HZ326_4318 [Fusarium oxysporum f. sp. albedinis]|nr:Uncharacterized protein HZ326_4318 [Fusarium oxysporum f. sp. albedinis]
MPTYLSFHSRFWDDSSSSIELNPCSWRAFSILSLMVPSKSFALSALVQIASRCILIDVISPSTQATLFGLSDQVE